MDNACIRLCGHKISIAQRSGRQPLPNKRLGKRVVKIQSQAGHIVNVHIDGACQGKSANRKAAYGIAWGIDHRWNEAEAVVGNQTSTRGEITVLL